MSKKEKEELKPSIIPVGEPDKQIALDTEKDDILIKTSGKDDSGDSFFKKIVDKLFSGEKLGAKTEYLSLKESFAVSRLEFLGKYCGMPYALGFLQSFRTDRISYQRKGRIEIVKALEKRQEEIEFQSRQLMMGRGGMGGLLNG